MHTDKTLRKAKALIDTPAKWTQYAQARRSDDRPCSYNNPDAICFSIYGAIQRVAGIITTSKAPCPLLVVARQMGFGCVAAFNNHPDTTHDDVMTIFDRAIALAEGNAA